MSGQPTGTVSLLFSDVEGSTSLLGRLGSAYADALDGQRTVLRAAWSAHSGTELGTEGDNFFVAFATAPAAVSAAVEAQRGLAAHPWPDGEPVRVRIGIHTGSPTVHDGGYVGMDVHRAARIAGAAHGGQVVLSAATAELAAWSLPDGAQLRDLGSHQLKDIPHPEHLFQVEIPGLPTDFPPLRTLGAAVSLPTPGTALVGRDGELAELAAVLALPGVRLVTLTGPGGSGKTRLAIELARRLVEAYTDGVYFVPLATATTADVMWTTIAETLDVPPEGRTPPAFFTHVAHRSAVFVLDNLEQLAGADSVVARLLAAAPQVIVVATSRRPLHVPDEHEHAVPPLELPSADDLDDVVRSGAVQLFVQHSRQVRSSFALTVDNAADVAAVCRRLDGLPLAVELAAARSKVLSPRALLARLDTALDIAASGRQVPSRQKTLRDTISWSYDLLTPDQQGFLRRLGVFAGGADLDAITAVTAPDQRTDALDLVADLADASLVTVTETTDGEPRIGLLETIRAFARDQLAATDELADVRERHAQHYLQVAEELSPLLVGAGYLAVGTRLVTEQDNFREILTWSLPPPATVDPQPELIRTGLRLCAALGPFWFDTGSFAEGRRWLKRGIEAAGRRDSIELAHCLRLQADIVITLGDPDLAYDCATASVEMSRRLGDTDQLPRALSTLAAIAFEREQPDVARPLFEEALSVARASGDKWQLRRVLGDFAYLESLEGNHQRSLGFSTEALSLARELGDLSRALRHEWNMACTLRLLGFADQAGAQLRSLIPQALALNEPVALIALVEDYAAVLADLGEHRAAVRLLGVADARREQLDAPRLRSQETELAEPMAKARAALLEQEWNAAYRDGLTTPVEDALTEIREARPVGTAAAEAG